MNNRVTRAERQKRFRELKELAKEYPIKYSIAGTDSRGHRFRYEAEWSRGLPPGNCLCTVKLNDVMHTEPRSVFPSEAMMANVYLAIHSGALQSRYLRSRLIKEIWAGKLVDKFYTSTVAKALADATVDMALYGQGVVKVRP